MNVKDYLVEVETALNDSLNSDSDYLKSFNPSNLAAENKESVLKCLDEPHFGWFGYQFVEKFLNNYVQYVSASLYNAVYEVEYFQRNKRTRKSNGEGIARNVMLDFLKKVKRS